MVAKDYFIDVIGDYGIKYQSPIYEFAQSSDDVKYRLLQIGVSTKSLEGISVFADSFTTPSDEVIMSYLSRKEPIFKDIVDFLTGNSLEVHYREDISTLERGHALS